MMKKRLLKQTTLSTKETSFCLIDEPAKQTRKNFCDIDIHQESHQMLKFHDFFKFHDFSMHTCRMRNKL